jgi:D-alanyl-D-alanine carboxypeptidase/D-alanyl-D-alanine-endopeptidase (penicillin-binding protein 4)
LALAAQLAASAELHELAAAARKILGAGQGAYVEAAGGAVLLAQNAAKPVHPASVSKVPTTLALLRKLGPEHRFVTTFATSGRIVEGTLQGDLLVQSDGDPSLVDEDALLVAERLREAGIERIAGEVRLQRPLTFDWQLTADGAPLREALSGRTHPAAWNAVRALAQGASQSESSLSYPAVLGIQFGPGMGTDGALHPDLLAPAGSAASSGPDGTPARPLVIHRSQPLLPLVKALNDYSNNIFAQLAEAVSGAPAVETLARSVVPPEMSREITLGDGAGEDPSNRLSPRAAVKLLRALEHELASGGHTLPEVLPVAGVDEGTLRDRLDAPGEAGRVVGKTGTFDSYGASALIGAISTPGWGTVYFAILDHGIPSVKARRRQDRFVRVLLSKLHGMPWRYQRDDRPSFARAEVEALLHR